MTSAFMLWLGTTHTALILKNATGLGSSSGKIGGGGTDLFYVINHLLGPMLIIVVAIAPLAIAWGAAMMIFDGRHGPQVMASAVIAVVLVGAAKGIAV